MQMADGRLLIHCLNVDFRLLNIQRLTISLRPMNQQSAI